MENRWLISQEFCYSSLLSRFKDISRRRQKVLKQYELLFSFMLISPLSFIKCKTAIIVCAKYINKSPLCLWIHEAIPMSRFLTAKWFEDSHGHKTFNNDPHRIVEVKSISRGIKLTKARQRNARRDYVSHINYQDARSACKMCPLPS